MNDRQGIRIITDTTASLPPGYAAAHGVPVVPQVIVFGAESHLESYEITAEQFVARLQTSTLLPKTQAPPPGEFIKVFAQELESADTLLCLHPSGDVSGTVRSAHIAKESAFPQADIRIIDTRTIGANLGSLVRAAVAWWDAGLDADAIVARVHAMSARGRTYCIVPTLEYLRRGGRIGGASALLGSMLQIKPVLQFLDGRVVPYEKVRTWTRAKERLVELVVEQCPADAESYLCIMHAVAADEGRQLAAILGERLAIAPPPLLDVGAAITTHTGPGVLGVGFFEKDRNRGG